MRYVDLKTSPNKKKKARKSPSSSQWGKTLLLALFFVGLIFTLRIFTQPITSALADLWENSTSVIFHFISGPREIKSDAGLTNVLLVGIDRRSFVPYSFVGPDGEIHHNGFLADTIIVASFNHEYKKLTLLSLPRDLWTKTPPFNDLQAQYTKINAAHALGDQYNYPQGGMALLAEIVEETLDLPIHYWIRIDFEAFTKGVDAIGGVDVLVDRSFDDYMYPKAGFENAPWEERFEYVHFDEGLQHMDGTEALKFARSRRALGPEGTDFARAKRQQKVILAAKNKILSTSTLFNLNKLKNLYFALSGNIQTNADLAEFPLFFELAQKFREQKIETYVLNGGEEENLLYSPDPEQFGGAWVLLPIGGDWSKIRAFTHRIFTEPGTVAGETESTP